MQSRCKALPLHNTPASAPSRVRRAKGGLTRSSIRICNPLLGYTRAELRAQVEQFCSQHDFPDKVDVFYRGALAAQNPQTYNDVEELTDDDKFHLRREVTHKWHLPKQFYYAIALCSLGSAVQGWDNTGANGANLSFPQGMFPWRIKEALDVSWTGAECRADREALQNLGLRTTQRSWASSTRAPRSSGSSQRGRQTR